MAEKRARVVLLHSLAEPELQNLVVGCLTSSLGVQLKVSQLPPGCRAFEASGGWRLLGAALVAKRATAGAKAAPRSLLPGARRPAGPRRRAGGAGAGGGARPHGQRTAAHHRGGGRGPWQ